MEATEEEEAAVVAVEALEEAEVVVAGSMEAKEEVPTSTALLSLQQSCNSSHHHKIKVGAAEVLPVVEGAADAAVDAVAVLDVERPHNAGKSESPCHPPSKSRVGHLVWSTNTATLSGL